jgi:hypothetical protein
MNYRGFANARCAHHRQKRLIAQSVYKPGRELLAAKKQVGIAHIKGLQTQIRWLSRLRFYKGLILALQFPELPLNLFDF